MFFAVLTAILASAPPPEGAPPEAPFVTAPRTAEPVRTVEFDTARFHIVASERAEAPARALAPDLETLRDEVRTLVGRDWPGTTEVRVALGREEYEAMALPGSRPPGWAVALAWPAMNVVLVDARTIATPEGKTTLRHELVHIALGRLGNDWPRWFQEGVAQMVTNERQFRTEHYSTMAIAIATDRLYDFEVLRDGFPERPQDVEVAYAQSAEFVSFLFKRHGPAAFGELIDHVGNGVIFEQAFARAFHSSLTVEEADFRDDVALRYPWWPVLLGSGTALWALSGLLMAFAHVRRRRQVKALREHQKHLEQLEDTAVVLLGALPHAANEDGGAAVDPFPGVPWRITAVRSAS
ncbi:MAG: DUF1570 domain-containing protein [Myxococcaceae bacterium]|nr:DUF1570 domain-containing protein [Myxococcaceae bacterium]